MDINARIPWDAVRMLIVICAGIIIYITRHELDDISRNVQVQVNIKTLNMLTNVTLQDLQKTEIQNHTKLTNPVTDAINSHVLRTAQNQRESTTIGHSTKTVEPVTPLHYQIVPYMQ